jgi:hypothetical protein
VFYTGAGYELRVQRWSSPVEVDDAPYFVRTLRVASASVELVLSDGAAELLDPTTLEQGADNTLYCRIARGGWALACRFSAHQYHELALAFGTDAGCFVIGERAVSLKSYSRQPLPL